MWLGTKPTNCDVCRGTLGSVFYDARLPSYGSWGIICHLCFQAHNCKLGTGYGQKYSTKTLEKLGG